MYLKGIIVLVFFEAISSLFFFPTKKHEINPPKTITATIERATGPAPYSSAWFRRKRGKRIKKFPPCTYIRVCPSIEFRALITRTSPLSSATVVEQRMLPARRHPTPSYTLFSSNSYWFPHKRHLGIFWRGEGIVKLVYCLMLKQFFLAPLQIN